MQFACNLGQKTDEYFVNTVFSQIVANAFFSVDTFFWVAGFLAAMSLLRITNRILPVSRPPSDPNSSAKNKRKLQILWKSFSTYTLWIPFAYLHRYLRMVPMMMIITSFQWKLLGLFPNSPLMTMEDRNLFDGYCNKEWYQILFMYRNLLDYERKGNILYGSYILCIWRSQHDPTHV